MTLLLAGPRPHSHHWLILQPVGALVLTVLAAHHGDPAAAQAQPFESLELTGAERRLPGALSSGLARRVAFARALDGHLLVLREGKVVEQGQTRTVLAEPGRSYTREPVAADLQARPHAPLVTAGETMLKACDLSVSRGKGVLFEGLDLSVRACPRIERTP